ncbi:sel1 repeat family protein [Litorivicinus sp.]|nr:sel1 repeat family protein [Litorivicinus sp.]
MKKSLLAQFFLLILLVSPMSFGFNLQKGVTAYTNGDYATALKEFTPLAEQGNAYVQTMMGAMYFNGQGVPQDYQAAVKWFRLAAEQGIASAQHNLGVMYENGQGVPKDDQAAVKWYRLAAEQGLASAQFNLGNGYANGQGVLQDNIYAHMWLNIAASLGNDSASKNRERISKDMTPADISAAQKLARECVAKDYKGC